MDQFIAKHADKLQGTLSCFDRVLFRGYLPFFSGYAMASFLDTRGIRRREVKRFVLTQAYRLKDHARQMAARAGRPYQYFGSGRAKKSWRANWPNAMGSRRGSSVSSPWSNRAAPSRSGGAKGRPSFSRRDGSA